MKIAIIGTAPGWERAPWDDETWTRWGLNDGYLQHGPDRRCHAWWELHGDTPLTRSRRPEDHFERIADMAMPVYYLHGAPPTPLAVKLDTDALAAVWRDHFACTNAYQIALALKMGATEIALYGTPLAGAREACVERPCVSAWLGFAEGRGVRVTVEHDNRVGLWRHPFRYADDDAPERESTYWEVMRLYSSIYEWTRREAESVMAV